MKWSWRVGRILDIDVKLHVTFLLLLGWVGVSYYMERRELADAASGVGFVLTLFGIVVLHELGHALTARRFGIRTRDITLLPIGGVARLERMPDDPREELLVALAGPAVNVALAGLIAAAMLVTETPLSAEVALVGGDPLRNLLWVNVVLAGFNMLPAFPMDGGRVLRALLAMRLDYVRATQIAASVGQALALFFGFVGLFVNPFLVFIGLFVWMGAAGEASLVQMKSSLGGIPVSWAMISDFRAVSPTDSLQRVANYIIEGFQQDFPVLEEDGRIVGVLTRSDLMAAAAADGLGTLVGSAMRTEFQTAHATEMLEPAFMRLQSCDCRTMPVTRAGQLVGVLTMENVGEFLMLQAAVGRAGEA